MYKNDKVKLCNDHELLGSMAMGIVSYGKTYSPPILVHLPCFKLDKIFILKDNRCIITASIVGAIQERELSSA